MSQVSFRERVIHAGSASIDNGVITIRDSRGVIRWSNSPADRPDARDQQDFNLNTHRLHHLEKLIAARYGGACDCDGDADAYLSVGLNAMALDCRMRGWKPHIGPLLKWAKEWVPVADPNEVRSLAEKVIKKPRRFTAATAGKLVGLTQREWEGLGIKFIDPGDMDVDELLKFKAAMARKADRDAKAAARRVAGKPTARDRSENSIKLYCQRYGISPRSLRAARARGPAALTKFLAKHGIIEKLPVGFGTIGREPILMSRTEAATFQAAGAFKAPPAEGSKGDCSRSPVVGADLFPLQERRDAMVLILRRAADIVGGAS
ncbi:hypothetical protein HFN78_14220 [Rhizobium laguerreae]|uniref:hypothetical protein n=1 Tax=Rhizobium laguerreae TaxID=1076926 RepID=UPI001C9033C0|nr:hypothetical protein [Rhizobium laguerreae]MBY3472074.1 hypothetical protein [Rhizobium laguerreae]